MKSSFSIYDKWELEDGRTLRFYYFNVNKDRQRNYVIKRKQPGEPKNVIISSYEAASLIKGKPTLCIRYWDREKKQSNRIEQYFNEVDVTLGDVKRSLRETLRSFYKRMKDGSNKKNKSIK